MQKITAAILLIFCVGHASISAAADKPPAFAPRVLKPWQQTGATQMWLRPAKGEGYALVPRREQPRPGDLPCMYFPCVTTGNIASLPAPALPFGIQSVIPELQNQYLTGIAKLKQLTYLHVEGAGVSRQQLKEIGRSKSLSHLYLHHLDLGDLNADVAVKIVCQAALQWLSLQGNAVTDASLATFSKLPRLKHLDLRQTKVTPAGIARLKQRRPGLQIQH